MRSTSRSLVSLRFLDESSSGRLKGKIVTLGAGLFALLSGNHLVAASQPSASFSPATHPGGVTLLAINTSRTQSRSIKLPMAGERYSLAAETLESPSVKLNGQTLHLGRNDELPPLRGATVKAGVSTLQPATITFLTFATANNVNCH
jgi:hypothetical protein